MSQLLKNLLLALFISACSTGVRCPQYEASEKVALIDHGRHASLVLPSKDGKLFRYVYGDWQYYALNQTGITSGMRALLWPTKAGLGRMKILGPVSLENLDAQLKVGIEDNFIFKVSPEAIERLNLKLNEPFVEHTNKVIYNSNYDLNFVPMDRNYWAFNNSNQKVASWLEELGCKVRGYTLLSSWRKLND